MFLIEMMQPNIELQGGRWKLRVYLNPYDIKKPNGGATETEAPTFEEAAQQLAKKIVAEREQLRAEYETKKRSR